MCKVAVHASMHVPAGDHNEIGTVLPHTVELRDLSALLLKQRCPSVHSIGPPARRWCGRSQFRQQVASERVRPRSSVRSNLQRLLLTTPPGYMAVL